MLFFLYDFYIEMKNKSYLSKNDQEKYNSEL